MVVTYTFSSPTLSPAAAYCVTTNVSESETRDRYENAFSALLFALVGGGGGGGSENESDRRSVHRRRDRKGRHDSLESEEARDRQARHRLAVNLKRC